MHQFKQGTLDGMCGVYAVINAINHVTQSFYDHNKAERLFIKLVKKNKKMFPEAMYAGTNFSMITTMSEQAIKRLSIRLTYPFLKKKPKKISEYLNGIRKILKSNTAAAIVAVGPGLHVTDGHWTVITKITPTQVYFLDSSYTVKCMSRRDLSFGFSPGKLGVYPTEVVILSKFEL